MKDMRWNGIKNGRLILLLAENKFDYWIVVDKNISYQQNTKEIPFTIIVLGIFRNTLKSLLAIVPQIIETLNNPVSEGYYHKWRIVVPCFNILIFWKQQVLLKIEVLKTFLLFDNFSKLWLIKPILPTIFLHLFCFLYYFSDQRIFVSSYFFRNILIGCPDNLCG